jgi:Zn-dependent protease with chaperone function
VTAASAPAAPPATEQPPPVLAATVKPPVEQERPRTPAGANAHADSDPTGTVVRAALAVWVMLGFFMLFFCELRSISLTLALGALAVALIGYAVGTAMMLWKEQKWISDDAAEPEPRRIYTALSELSARAGLPMPKVALETEVPDINAWTYGLGRGQAHIVVTQGLLDHLKPTDDELRAVLAHELGHIHSGDFIASSLLRFPLWVMGKIQVMLSFARDAALVALRIFSQVAAGWIGLVIILGLLMVVLYLSLGIFMVGVMIFISMLALYAFEREREYHADRYSAWLLGTPAPLENGLAKLELAAERVRKELESRQANAKENEEIDLKVAAPLEAFNPGPVIEDAVKRKPTFLGSLQQGEFLTDHPLTGHRLYYLENPADLKRRLSVWSASLAGYLDRLLAANSPETTESLPLKSLWVGAAVGLLAAVLPAISGHWAMDVIQFVSMLAGGGALGFFALQERWTGKAALHGLVAAAYVTATTLLVVGPVVQNPVWIGFPLLFPFALAIYIAAGFAALKLLPAWLKPAAGHS